MKITKLNKESFFKSELFFWNLITDIQLATGMPFFNICLQITFQFAMYMYCKLDIAMTNKALGFWNQTYFVS